VAQRLSIFCAVMTVLLFAVSAKAQQKQAYEGQIEGHFYGWEGESVYNLIDGHIIQQSQFHYHYHYHYAFSPRVIIYRSSGGGYKIHVEGDSDQDVGIVVLK